MKCPMCNSHNVIIKCKVCDYESKIPMKKKKTKDQNINALFKELGELRVKSIPGRTINTRDNFYRYIESDEFHKIIKKYKVIFGVE